MHALDWTMVCAYFALMIVIGWCSHKRVSDVKDFFTAGGRMPWWLAGISHHMSGYSAVLFVALTMLVATQAQNLGGVLQIVVNWVAALMGPISIPLLLGMLPWFRKCGPRAALVSWAGGLLAYALCYYVFNANQTVLIATPILVSLALYAGLGLLAPERSAAADEIVDTVNADDDVDRKQEGTTVPA